MSAKVERQAGSGENPEIVAGDDGAGSGMWAVGITAGRWA